MHLSILHVVTLQCLLLLQLQQYLEGKFPFETFDNSYDLLIHFYLSGGGPVAAAAAAATVLSSGGDPLTLSAAIAAAAANVVNSANPMG